MATAPCSIASEPAATEPEWPRSGQNLRDLALPLRLMLSTGTPVAIATVVSARGPAPRRPGTVLVTSQSGQTIGFNPAGPLDRAIRDLATAALATGHPRLASLQIDADAASYIGLSGAVRLDVQATPVQAGDPDVARALRYLDSGEATVLVIGTGCTPGYAVVGARRVIGRLSWPELPAAIIADARSLLGTPRTAHKNYGHHGERGGTSVHLWMQSYPAT